MHEGNTADAVFLDFRKAFDTVSHSNFLGMLSNSKISRFMLHSLSEELVEGCGSKGYKKMELHLVVNQSAVVFLRMVAVPVLSSIF